MRRLARTRTISESDKRLMLEVKEAVTRLVPDAEVILYGSTARGQRQPDSDYDLLVLTDRELDVEGIRALYDVIYDIELERDVLMSLARYSREQWESSVFRGSLYQKSIMKEGIVL